MKHFFEEAADLGIFLNKETVDLHRDFERIAKLLPGKSLINIKQQGRKTSIEIEAKDEKTGDDCALLKVDFDYSSGRACLKTFLIDAEQARGKGISRKVIPALVELAKNSDLKGMDLTADLTDGALVWAKYGWTTASSNEMARLYRNLNKRLTQLRDDEISKPDRHILQKMLDPKRKIGLKELQVVVDFTCKLNPELAYKLFVSQTYKASLDFDDKLAMNKLDRTSNPHYATYPNKDPLAPSCLIRK